MINPLPLLISNALRHSKDNGYDLESMTDEEIAEDLSDYDSDIAGYPLSEIVYYVGIQRL